MLVLEVSGAAETGDSASERLAVAGDFAYAELVQITQGLIDAPISTAAQL